MKKFSTKDLVKVAVIAALYVAVTLAFAPISYGEVQFRISEVLTLFAFFNPIFIPGLVLGTVIANFASPLGIVDVVAGSFATFLAVSAIWQVRKNMGDGIVSLIVASFMPVIMNGLIIGWELNYLFDIPFVAAAISVAIGEFVVVTIAGVVVMKLLSSNSKFMELMK